MAALENIEDFTLKVYCKTINMPNSAEIHSKTDIPVVKIMTFYFYFFTIKMYCAIQLFFTTGNFIVKISPIPAVIICPALTGDTPAGVPVISKSPSSNDIILLT